jgi:hypothetical protein
VIGPTVRRAAALDWFMSRPLAGERLGLFAGGDGLAPALDVAGAEVVEAPRPFGSAARIAVGAAPLTGFVLRSAAEVEALEEERGLPGLDPELRALCVGRAAADRARALGWARVELLEEHAGAEAIVAAIAGRGETCAAIAAREA